MRSIQEILLRNGFDLLENGCCYTDIHRIERVMKEYHSQSQSPQPSKDVEAAAKELADELAETVQHDRDDIHQSLVYGFIAGAKWAEQAKEATPVDGGKK